MSFSLCDMFSGANLPDTRPIICSVTSEPVPWTNATSDPKIIRIYLSLPNESLQELDYHRFAYQLSHELAHVIMNARRTNGLIETLADAVSYQSLDDLAKLWLKKYSNHKPWRDFAPSFQRYRKVKVEQKWLLRLPREVQDAVHQGQWSDIASYLRQRQSELDTNPFNDTGYTLRSLGVMALRSDSLPWKDFAGIASLTNPSPSQDNRYRKDLSVDISRTSNEVQNALRRLVENDGVIQIARPQPNELNELRILVVASRRAATKILG